MNTPTPFIFHQGTQPLLISMPHVGTFVPPEIARNMTPQAQQVPDTDWHIERLYAFAKNMGASIIQATYSRYVADLNRPPGDESLYPGQATTSLCPVETFEGGSIYQQDKEPDQAEIEHRRIHYWQPYHDQLAAELARMRQQFPAVVLWDAHSIRSVLPRFFEGKLPDFNIGTNSSQSCATELQSRIQQIAQQATGYTSVLNGRYKGGYITRHYGQPAQQVHAVQLEMAQCIYMEEQLPFAYHNEKASQVQPHLRAMLEAALDFARNT
ncbi:N-formylglutamate deformylase [Saezia sanguinis]|uniref:N-formylglutamate deformylase n=1 Tax=Saezia sanguinis TaxID=1965230 RepID=UPI00304F910B